MKNKKIYVCLLLIIYLLNILGGFSTVDALSTGEEVLLKTDYECKSLVQFWLESYGYWSFKVIHYVYYNDFNTNIKYPAFCIEPEKEGIGIKYDSYNTSIEKSYDNVLWRILNKGYMGKTYQDWNLEADDDLYSATLIAIHSYKENLNPKSKYRVGIKGIDGLSLEEVQRRGSKVLDVAEELYNYGLNGKEVYEEPMVYIKEIEKEKHEKINDIEYLVYEYKVDANRKLESYVVNISDFTEGTLVLDMSNNVKSNFSNSNFKIAIPIDNINKDIEGIIKIENAKIKTCPIFCCKSLVPSTQSYITYTSSYEYANVDTKLNLKLDTASLEIIKKDDETKKPIENVTFKIFNSNNEELGEYKTDKSGKIILKDMKPQTIYVQEISAPKQYKINNEKIKINLKWGEVSKIEIINKLKEGKLEITKIEDSEEKKTLEGVEFDLLDENKKIIKHDVTDKNGKIVFDNLSKGIYFVRETKTLREYVLDDKEYKIEIKPGENTKLEITNDLKKGSLEILKIDESDEKIVLEGVEFDLFDENNDKVGHIITDKDGKAKINDLSKGKYLLKEVKTKDEYILDKTIYEIEIKPGENFYLKIENEKKPEPKIEIEIPKLPKTGF